MTSPLPRLAAALSDRYRLENELGQGGTQNRELVVVENFFPELANQKPR